MLTLWLEKPSIFSPMCSLLDWETCLAAYIEKVCTHSVEFVVLHAFWLGIGGWTHRWHHHYQHFAFVEFQCCWGSVQLKITEDFMMWQEHQWHTRLYIVCPFLFSTLWCHLWSFAKQAQQHGIYLFIFSNSTVSFDLRCLNWVRNSGSW